MRPSAPAARASRPDPRRPTSTVAPLGRWRGAAGVCAAFGITLGATAPALAQEPAAVPAALAAELVDAGQALRPPDAPRVVVGRLPDGFPAVPLPDGARVLGGAVWRTGNVVAIVQLDGAPQQARTQVLAALDAAGWKAPPPPNVPDPEFPRFLSSTSPDPERDATRCAPGDSTTAVIVGARARDGHTLVRLLAPLGSRAVRCRVQAAPTFRRVVARRTPLPVLPAPEGVRVQPEGTSSSQDEVTATARALADSAGAPPPNAVAVLAHYARALASGGWTRVPVPGWDTTRTTPVFVSPADSTGARYLATVDARPDTAARGAARSAPPALTLRLRVAQFGFGAPGAFGAFMSSSYTTVSGASDVYTSTVRAAGDTARRPRRPPGPPVSRELAEALLGAPLGVLDGTGGSERLADGRAPAGWNAPVPDMTGARVLGGWRRAESGPFPVSWLVLVATAPGAPADVAAAFGRQLDRAGWRTPPDHGLAGASVATGFVASAAPERARRSVPPMSRCAPAGDGYLNASVVDRAYGAGSLLQLTLLHGAYGGLCGGEDRPEVAALREAHAPVPPLTPPAGFTVLGGEGGGGDFELRISATVRGAANPAAVVAAYAAQLRAAGWTVDSAAVSPSLAAVPVRRTVPAADSAGAAGGARAVPDFLAGPQQWSGLLTAARRPDGSYATTLDVRRAFGQER